MTHPRGACAAHSGSGIGFVRHKPSGFPPRDKVGHSPVRAQYGKWRTVDYRFVNYGSGNPTQRHCCSTRVQAAASSILARLENRQTQRSNVCQGSGQTVKERRNPRTRPNASTTRKVKEEVTPEEDGAQSSEDLAARRRRGFFTGERTSNIVGVVSLRLREAIRTTR